MKTLKLFYGDRKKIKALKNKNRFFLTIECELNSQGEEKPNSRLLEYNTEKELFEAFKQFTN
jgi:hypothetical protein